MTEQEEFEFRSRLESEQVASAPAAPAKRSLVSMMADPLAGPKALEGGLSIATGAIAAPIAGIAGVTVPALASGKSADVVKTVQDALTYQPRSDLGKKIVETAGAIVEPVGKVAEAAGRKTLEATGSPELATAADTAVQTLIPPGVGAVAGGVKAGLKGTARSLMNSAVKPMWKDLKTGDAAKAIDTLLDEGVSPTPSGMAKLREKIDLLNDQIKDKISASNATVDVQMVGRALQDTVNRFAMQVNPKSDLATIKAAWDEFQTHPALGGGTTLPVSLAQKMKQGTYRVLAGKYGEVGSAATESQKALARGLKEEVAAAVPGVAGLNAQESLLLNALKVGERRALFEANKNPMGLSLLAQNPAAWAAFMADRSAAFKALAARMANRASEGLPDVATGAAIGAGAVAATQ